jgi:hypothetical protein
MDACNTPVLCEPILDTMIELAFAARSHRTIVAGSAAFDLYQGLCRRGFWRTAIASHPRAAFPAYDVALIAGQETTQALERVLVQIAPLLNGQASIATWIDSNELHRGRRIQVLLERLGFRVESGTKCEVGFVLAARRSEPVSLALAA